MESDQKRELLRHLVATVAFRTSVAVRDAPAGFADFRSAADVRSPAEVLAHIGDLLEGSLVLLQGGFVELISAPLPWDDEIERVMTKVRDLDTFLASDAPISHTPERFIQGPIGDALTHIGQIVMLRRLAGAPVDQVPYFTAEIAAGTF